MRSTGDTGPDLDTVLDRVVELSHPPERTRVGLKRSIKSLVYQLRRASDSDEEQQNLVMIFKQWTERRVRMIEARGRLRDAAIELKKAIKDYDWAYGRRDRYEEVAPPPIDRLLREVLKWSKQPFNWYEGEEGPGRGRPHAHVSLIKFVVYLLVVVRMAGGDLTYDKNRTEKSTLVCALEILRPHLSDIIPIALPVRALLTARSLASEGFHAYRRWESDLDFRMVEMMRRKLEWKRKRHRNKKHPFSR
jgi:hypothetical protein